MYGIYIIISVRIYDKFNQKNHAMEDNLVYFYVDRISNRVKYENSKIQT